MVDPGAPLPVDPWASSADAQQPAAQVLGPYELLGPLGQGGMGVVHRARHRQLGVVRAVKVMLRADAKALARFQREVANLARVRHPNVAGIHEAGSDAGRPWFAMELVEGEPLSRLLERGRPPLERALVLAIGLAEGVAALHAAGIIHRDLKPQNVIVRPDGRPVVIDLGLAVAPEQDTRLTKTGAMLGTLAYMAPEQLGRGKDVGPQADVYALGCVLFELVTGVPALEGGKPVHEVVAEVLTRERPRPSAVDPGLPASLDEVCARAMAREPADRYPDAAALALALREVLAGPREPARRGASRGALVAVGLVAAAAVALGLGLSLQRDEDYAEGSDPGRFSRADLERGRRALEDLRARPPAERLALLDDWLLAFDDHPSEGEATRLRLRTLLETPLRRLDVRGAKRALFTDDAGEQAVTCAESGEVALWDLRTGERQRAWQAVSSIRDAATAGGQLALLDERSRPWIVDLSTGAARALDPTATGEVVAISPDGEHVAVGCIWSSRIFAPRVALIDRRSGTVVQAPSYPAQVTVLAFSPDGRTLVIGYGASSQFSEVGLDRGVVLYDVRRQAERHRLAIRGLPTAGAFVPDGRRVVVADHGHLQLLDVEAGAWREELAGDHGAVWSMAAGADRLLSLSDRGELRVWDLAAPAPLGALRVPREASRVAASADGRRALVVTPDAVELWDTAGLAP